MDNAKITFRNYRDIIPNTFSYIDQILLPDLADICCSYLIGNINNRGVSIYSHVYDAFLHGCGEMMRRHMGIDGSIDVNLNINKVFSLLCEGNNTIFIDRVINNGGNGISYSYGLNGACEGGHLDLINRFAPLCHRNDIENAKSIIRRSGHIHLYGKFSINRGYIDITTSHVLFQREYINNLYKVFFNSYEEKNNSGNFQQELKLSDDSGEDDNEDNYEYDDNSKDEDYREDEEYSWGDCDDIGYNGLDSGLYIACKNGWKEDFDKLLDILAKLYKWRNNLGIDIANTNVYFDRLLGYACEGGNHCIIDKVIELHQDNCYDKFAGMAGACKGGHFEILKMIYQLESNYSWVPDCAEMILTIACGLENPNEEIIDYLLGLGVKDVRNAKLSASRAGNVEILKKLLIIDSKYLHDCFLESACMKENNNCVDVLLAQDAHFTDQSMYYACERGDDILVDKIIKSSYHSIVDLHRSSILDKGLISACVSGYTHLALKMIELGATNINDGLYSACKNGHGKLADILVELGAGVKESYCCKKHTERIKDEIQRKLKKFRNI